MRESKTTIQGLLVSPTREIKNRDLSLRWSTKLLFLSFSFFLPFSLLFLLRNESTI